MKNANKPGIAMTRSFGDKAGRQAGLIGEPEVTQHEICEEDKLLIIASDGIWEILNNEEVIQLVKASYLKGDLNNAGEALLKEACQIWKDYSYSRDDITFIIVRLNAPSQ